MTEAHWKERAQIAGQQMREAYARAKNTETECERYLKALATYADSLSVSSSLFVQRIRKRVGDILISFDLDLEELGAPLLHRERHSIDPETLKEND